ncbi:hypothetical protein [[Clostridium] hylemonae]|uniref:SipW-cognate class signal peptide n=1 Tax=[Clostridium] hylemonae DSM 15053 TaxID=553973 RepID=C0BY22_9FIRM|nr:hypothetical protein [[Clostridium] hylemonae]EEG75179.1 hypothetical protein CLOHYLEM_04710 [[Clostridium] hylemonae DSM 15053]QEK18114.1 hypothetical protein LAJLEIBI_02130 [[Clostridium] hylemonae DSM 15053]
MQKLGKKKILGLLTAAAIVATTVGSFAVWDTLSTKSNGTLTVASPIVVKTQDIGEFTETKASLEATPSYNKNVTFEVDGLANAADKQLKLGCKITDGSNVDQTGNFTVEITGTGNNAVTNNVDPSVEASNTYTVTITPNDTPEAKAIAGQALNVEVTGTLGDAPSTP